MWKTEPPQPKYDRAVFDDGDIHLAIMTHNGEQAQHISVSVCRFSDQSREKCMETWPREAIRLARQKLNAFEAQLEGEGDLP